jgi:hypothetical protein
MKRVTGKARRLFYGQPLFGLLQQREGQPGGGGWKLFETRPRFVEGNVISCLHASAGCCFSLVDKSGASFEPETDRVATPTFPLGGQFLIKAAILAYNPERHDEA